VKLEEKEKYQREVQNIRKQVFVTVKGITFDDVLILFNNICFSDY